MRARTSRAVCVILRDAMAIHVRRSAPSDIPAVAVLIRRFMEEHLRRPWGGSEKALASDLGAHLQLSVAIP
jgi:hypothetical protein